MSGFQFGQSGAATSGSIFSGLQNRTAATTASGFGSMNFSTPVASASQFGSLSNTQTPSSGFGFPTAQQSTSANLFSTPGSGINFSSPTSQNANISFTTPTSQSAGINFTTPTSQPQFGGTLSFNTTSAPSTFALGQQQTSSTAGSAFGLTSAPSAFSIGQPAASTASSTGFAFGGSTNTGSSGFNFNPSSTPSSSFALGQPASSVAGSSGFAFGTSTTAQPASLFGTASTTTQPTLLLKPSTTSTAPSAIFGSPSIASTLGSATTASSLGGTVTSVPSLSFPTLGTTSTPTFGGTTTSSGLGLSTSTTSTTSSFGSSAIFSQPSFGFNISSSTSAVSTAPLGGTSTVGLGGVDTTQSKTGLAGRQESKTVKETVVNQEIVQTIEKFEEYIKTQKSASSEISQGSSKSFQKVAEDSDSLKQLLSRLTSGLQKNLVVVNKLKFDTAKCLKNVEMAQRTQVTPSGLQYDNMAPQRYFTELVFYFEEEMKSLQNEINNIEKYVRTSSHPKLLNSEELSLTMRRLHETFVALAGRIQALRSSVETQKQQYLDCRKKFYKDNTNIFEDDSGNTNKLLKPKIIGSTDLSGPSPFSASQNGFGLLPLSAADNNTPFTTGSALGWGRVPSQQPFFSLQSQQQPQSQSSLFSGGTNFSSLSTPQPVENQGFQLQKPPVGNKRGKR